MKAGCVAAKTSSSRIILISMSAMKVDIAWSPTEPNRFITVGTDIQLYEIEELKEGVTKPSGICISEYSTANNIATSSDHQYLKCFSWYPKPDHPLLLAVGMANGRVILESLDSVSSRDAEIAGRELVPKQSRACNCVSWNPTEANILLSGLDKYRGDNCVLVWDITRANYMTSAIEAVTFDRRPVFSIDSSVVSKPILELGSSESTQSLHWFHNNPKLFVCGMSSKNLKIYDTRDGSKHQEMTSSKAVFNLCVDPEVEHRLASSFENTFVLWDVRNFEKPVVTINEPKSILKLCWSPTRSGLLAVLCKDSSIIKLYDIQSPVGSDDVEPPIVERTLQPFASHSAMSFTWHPTQENRILTISQNNQLLDYTIFDRITLNWSPTSEIVWTYGRKILQCVDSTDEFYSCLNDISVIMRKRAYQGYGLKVPKVWMNAELAEDPALNGVWMWLDLVKAAVEADSKRRSNLRNHPKYEGVHSVICGENESFTSSQSEHRRVTWVGLYSTECKIIKYTSEERERALQLCGWGADLDSNAFLKFLERLESDGHFTRAAAIAVFNLDIRRAIKILSKGALSKHYKGSTDLNAIAMALAGYTEDKSALWREISSSLKSQLSDPHLRAMFAFLTTEKDSYEEILNESHIAVQDRLAFACLYLNDKKLADFLDGLKKNMTESGNLDGILLTGLTNDGLSLIQRYVDTSGDVQTASLIVLHTLPSQVCKDPRAQAWVSSYRNLLDTWKLWTQRAMFDVNWFSNNPHASKPTQQIFVSCNFCRRTVCNYLQFRPPSGTSRFSQIPASSANKKLHASMQISCCPGCRKPLPRCSLCLSHMGTPAGLHWQRPADNSSDRKKLTDFSNWLTWCQTCRHGGHSVHILTWFKHHNECPVTGCMCKCMTLDAVAKLRCGTNS